MTLGEIKITNETDYDVDIEKLLKEPLLKKITKDSELIDKLKTEIKIKRNLSPDNDYSKNPNRLGNLRDRLKESLEIYKKYAE